MNKFVGLVIALVMLSLTSQAQAGYGKGNHVISFSAGGVMAANSGGEVKGAGLGGGAAYRYYTHDAFSIGVDAAYDDYGQHYSEDDEQDIHVKLITTALVGRIDFWPRNEYASYFSLGAGSAYIEREFQESKKTENTGRANVFLALGFEAPLKRRWMWGAELRSTDPLGISVNAIGLKLTMSRRFGKEVKAPSNHIE